MWRCYLLMEREYCYPILTLKNLEISFAMECKLTLCLAALFCLTLSSRFFSCLFGLEAYFEFACFHILKLWEFLLLLLFINLSGLKLWRLHGVTVRLPTFGCEKSFEISFVMECVCKVILGFTSSSGSSSFLFFFFFFGVYHSWLCPDLLFPTFWCCQRSWICNSNNWD